MKLESTRVSGFFPSFSLDSQSFYQTSSSSFQLFSQPGPKEEQISHVKGNNYGFGKTNMAILRDMQNQRDRLKCCIFILESETMLNTINKTLIKIQQEHLQSN